jgi:hypothetical protein
VTARPLIRDRGTLRWALLLLLVDLGVWGLAVSLLPLHRGLALFVAWGALSLLVTAALYVDAARGGSPGALLKGERLPWLQPVLLPFRAVSWCTWLGARALRRGDGPEEVAPGLWVGPRPLPAEVRSLAARGVLAVVDLTSELPTLRAMTAAPWRRLALPTLDRTAPTDDALAAAVDWVVARRAEGVGVYVHCAFGRGRSGAFACAALIGLGHATGADEALARVRRGRPRVRVRGDQLEAVARFAARR